MIGNHCAIHNHIHNFDSLCPESRAMSPSSESKIGEASDNWGPALQLLCFPWLGSFWSFLEGEKSLISLLQACVLLAILLARNPVSQRIWTPADLDPFSRIWTPLQKCYYSAKIGCLIRAMLEVNFFTSFASLIEPSKCRLADWLAYASGKIWSCLDPLHCERPFVPVPNLTHSKKRGKVLMGGVKIIIGNGTVAISMNWHSY